MDMMQLRRQMMGVIAQMASGGGLPDKEFFVTTTSEMTLKEFMTAHPIPLKYTDEICWVRFYNENSTTSNGVINWAMFIVSGATKYQLLANYKNTVGSPDSLSFNTVSGNNNSYFSIVDDSITSASNTPSANKNIPSGTDVYVLHIPFNWTNFNMATTER